MSQALLELKNVSKTFRLESGRELEVLDNINIRLEKNETLALLGPSGSGKSTCLRIMCGLQEATRGEVISSGEVLHGINGDVSLVFQSFALFPWETIKRNIEISLYPLGLARDEQKRRVQNAIDIVGLDGFEEAYPRELSGGMKQRVGVARALAMERAILFLDEPFSALDVLTADTLRDEIMKIYLSKKTKTRSMMVVTHNIQEAVIMADRILVMGSNPGRIRAEFVNNLPYPRIPDSAPFLDLVSKIHGTITETYIPDAVVSTGLGGGRSKASPVEILPDVQLLEVAGLVEAIAAEGGAVDVFVLSADIGKDFGQTLYLVKAAELLGLVDTPKQQVVLTRDGQLFAKSEINTRKRMLHESFAKLFIVQKTTELLKESAIVRIPLSELKEKVSHWLPNEDPSKITDALISWGRYSEYFGYNDDTKSVYLDVGQEIH
jgi:NitT/TauT family transport system ATP-binding protein